MIVKKPVRTSHSYLQKLNGDIQTVFALLCPVRETDWVNGWNPELVLSESGLVEKSCVFVMPGQPEPSVWIVTGRDEVRFTVSFVKVTPRFVVTEIDIRLEECSGGTAAEVSYSHTALGPSGEAYVEDFSEEDYRAFMTEWEEELNHYLEHGTRRPAEGSRNP